MCAVLYAACVYRQCMERALVVRRVDVLRHEFYYWLCLGLDLSVSPAALMPHFRQLLLNAQSDKQLAASYADIEWSTLA